MSGQTIVEFLEARISDDELEARVCLASPEHTTRRWVRILAECAAKRAIVQVHQRFDDVQRMTYGDIHPCAECGSVDDSPVEWPCRTLKMIAAVYADHPGYRQEWEL